MDILVCVKHVPETIETELIISSNGKNLETEDLVFDINECDNYAMEEAIHLKEKIGGTVTVITVGSSETEATLRKCLAMGADKAIRLTDPAFEGSDAFVIAKILRSIIKKLNFDLVLTGALADDDAYSTVGPVLAELLKIPHATLVKKIILDDKEVIVNRELEGGLEEVIKVNLPALLTIQTGINEPRYVSIMAIRRARQKEIIIMGLSETGLSENDVGLSGSWVQIENMYIPPVEKKVELITGNLEEITSKLITILKSEGVF